MNNFRGSPDRVHKVREGRADKPSSKSPLKFNSENERKDKVTFNTSKLWGKTVQSSLGIDGPLWFSSIVDNGCCSIYNTQTTSPTLYG